MPINRILFNSKENTIIIWRGLRNSTYPYTFRNQIRLHVVLWGRSDWRAWRDENALIIERSI